MSTWEKPELYSLNVKQTKGNIQTTGNDSLIPDCIESFAESIFGDHTGDWDSNVPQS